MTEPERDFTFPLTEDELVELFKLVAQSEVGNGLGRVYALLGAVVVDSRGLYPSNIHYASPVVFDVGA